MPSHGGVKSVKGFALYRSTSISQVALFLSELAGNDIGVSMGDSIPRTMAWSPDGYPGFTQNHQYLMRFFIDSLMDHLYHNITKVTKQCPYY